MRKRIKNQSSQFRLEDYYTQRQVAAKLGFTEQTIIALRNKNLINSFQFSPRGKVFIDKKKFDTEDLPRLQKRNFNTQL